jgi:hypothetical protein
MAMLVGLLAGGEGGLSGLERATGIARNTLREFPARALGEPVPVTKLLTIGTGLRQWAKTAVRIAWRRVTLLPGPVGDAHAVCLALAAGLGAGAGNTSVIPPGIDELCEAMAGFVAAVVVVLALGTLAKPSEIDAGTHHPPYIWCPTRPRKSWARRVLTSGRTISKNLDRLSSDSFAFYSAARISWQLYRDFQNGYYAPKFERPGDRRDTISRKRLPDHGMIKR